MPEMKAGDRFLARLIARRRYRWMAEGALLATMAAALWLRAVQGRPERALPWPGALLALYPLGMAAFSADRRAMGLWSAFAGLILAAFLPTGSVAAARLAGIAAVVCALVMVMMLRSLSRDARFSGEIPVLESREMPQ